MARAAVAGERQNRGSNFALAPGITLQHGHELLALALLLWWKKNFHSELGSYFEGPLRAVAAGNFRGGLYHVLSSDHFSAFGEICPLSSKIVAVGVFTLTGL